MLKALALTAAAALVYAPAASAQHNDHAGHDHAKENHSHTSQPYSGPLSAAPAIEHVFTEAPDDHVMGAANAPTTIISYVSVTCGHCSKWFIEEWPAFKKEQIDTGNVRFILREFPTSPANLAMTGFIIASCAPESDYFDNIEYQMTTQATILEEAKQGRGKEAYGRVAARAGMENEDAIMACFNKQEGGQRIQRSYQRAQAAGVDGVPSFFVDGVKFTADASAKNLGAVVAAKAQGGVSKPFKMTPKTSK